MLLSLPFVAEGKLDLLSRHTIDLMATESTENKTKYVSAILKITDDADIEFLEVRGVIVLNRRDELLLAFIPLDVVEELSAYTGVSKMSIGKMAIPQLDMARNMATVDAVHAGVDFQQGYDGKGVVTGFSDIGFDPNHINFLDENGLPTRVRRLVNYVDSLGVRIELNDISEITEWKTDRDTEFHATHVAGIMAGGYTINGYGGIAPGADIVATTSDLYDATILAGVEDIVEYARREGKPAVVNLSLGSYTGPHDGTDLFCQYLDRIGEEAIVCLAAGNEGSTYNTLSKTFTTDDSMLKTFIYNKEWNGKHIHGATDIWSADSRSFDVAVCIYDNTMHKVIYTSDYVASVGSDGHWGVASESYATASDQNIEDFNNCFEGYIRVYSELNEDNGRYNVLLVYDVKTLSLDRDYNWSRYCPGIIIKGENGMRVDVFSDGVYSKLRSMGVEGYVSGNSSFSVSNMSCGRNTITIGMCSSRNEVPLLNGSTKKSDYELDRICPHSGYGTLLDGRILPHVCAPGSMIISSISTPYVNNQDDDFKSSLSAVEKLNGLDYYWYSTGGTSMSSPLVAGIFALWLQADPTLTVSEIRDIAMRTSNSMFYDIADPRWGASGCIDASAGLKEILKDSGVNRLSINKRLLIEAIGFKKISVTLVSALTPSVNIYDMTGRLVFGSCNAEETTMIDLSQTPAGIYMLEVKDGGERVVERIVVR